MKITSEQDWAFQVAYKIVFELYKDQHDPDGTKNIVPVWTRNGPYGRLTSAITSALKKEVEVTRLEMWSKVADARELVFDLFSQHCSLYDRVKDKTTYDHGFLSANESAQQALIAWKLIKEEDCRGK